MTSWRTATAARPGDARGAARSEAEPARTAPMGTPRVFTHAGCVVLTVPTPAGDLDRFLTPVEAWTLADALRGHAERLLPCSQRLW